MPQTNLLLTKTKRVLKRAGLKARKGLGQHFLVDDKALEMVASAAELKPSDIIIEVGPGLGILTGELARRAGKVVAVELDDNLAAMLKEQFNALKNITIISGDILKIDLASLLDECNITARNGYKVVANLPYYITSTVLRHFLEAELKPELLVVMVQKEVAEVVVAKPGDMSLLSVSVQFYGKPAIVGLVPAGSFYPPPKVDSAVLRIDVCPEQAAVTDVDGFFNLVRAGFSTKRKQVVNSLTHGTGLKKERIISLLKKSGIEPTRRAQTLSLDEWNGLWQQFQKIE